MSILYSAIIINVGAFLRYVLKTVYIFAYTSCFYPLIYIIYIYIYAVDIVKLGHNLGIEGGYIICFISNYLAFLINTQRF